MGSSFVLVLVLLVFLLCFCVSLFLFFKYGSIRKMQTILDGKLFSKKFLSVCFFQRLLLHFFFKDYFCTFLSFYTTFFFGFMPLFFGFCFVFCMMISLSIFLPLSCTKKK